MAKAVGARCVRGLAHNLKFSCGVDVGAVEKSGGEPPHSKMGSDIDAWIFVRIILLESSCCEVVSASTGRIFVILKQAHASIF
jgi:hypothetical protein